MFRVLFLIGLTVVCGSLGHVLLSKGMQAMGVLESYASLFPYFFSAMKNPWIIAGIVVELLYFLLWILVLAHAEVSFAVPMSALEYFFVTGMAIGFLQEKVDWNRWTGLFFICVGVFFVVRSWNREGLCHRG